MLRNYFKLAYRNILKERFFSFVNIFGLALSMSLGMMLIVIIIDHQSYDQIHEKKAQIFRITSYNLDDTGPFNGYASSPVRIGDYLTENYPEVLNNVQLLNGLRGEAKANGKILKPTRYFASANFTDHFDFPLIEAASKQPLAQPYSAILTREQSRRYFGDTSPLGEVLEIQDVGSFTITGVIDMSAKNHFEFDVLLSFNTLPGLALQNEDFEEYHDWGNIWMGYNYLLLQPDTDLKRLESVMTEAGRANIEFERPRAGYEFKLQHLNAISPGPVLSNMMAFTLPWIFLAFFGVLAMVVLITAIINYTNLSIARSLSRSREIGIRKTNGARRWQIFQQFIMESVLIAWLALILAIGLVQLLLTGFNNIWLIQTAELEIAALPWVYAWFFVFATLVGALAGFAPSLYLSRFKTIPALKGGGMATQGRNIPRKVLTVMQFFFSMVFVISILMVYQQTQYMIKADYGFNKENLLSVELQGHDPDIVRSVMTTHHAVLSSSMSSHHPASGRNHGTRLKRDPEAVEGMQIYQFWVDQGYLDNLEIKLIAGRNFPDVLSNENEKFVLINEAALKQYEFESPSDAIGEILYAGDSTALIIQGVIEDYHHQPMLNTIKPLALRYNLEEVEFLNLRLQSNDLTEIIGQLEGQWLSIDNERPFAYTFLADEMNTIFQGFNDILKLLTFITVLAIIIAVIGLLGMATLSTNTRLKEIGIRKVLGAEIAQIVWILSRSFVGLILLAILLAIPAAIVLNNLWLQEIAYRIAINPLIIIITALGLLSICVLAIASQTARAALLNPARVLRNE